MKRIAMLLTALSIAAVAGTALAEVKSQPVNCTPNAICGCTQNAAPAPASAPASDVRPDSFKEWLKVNSEVTP